MDNLLDNAVLGGAEIAEETPDLADPGPDSPRLRLFRFSRPDEIAGLLPLIEAGHRETRFGHLPFSQRKAVARLPAILNSPDKAVGYYVTKGERLVAAMDIGVGEPFLAEGGVFATCRLIYIAADIRKTLLGGRIAALLVAEAKTWARERGAEELMLYDTEGYLVRLLKGAEVDGANVVVKIPLVSRQL